MPEPLKKSEVNASNDPTVFKQYDTKTPQSKQLSELYSLIDKQSIGLLTTTRPNLGPVGRSMAIAKRNGPDLLFLANINSQKFRDLESSTTVQFTLQDSTTQNWVSMTGTATTFNNEDKRIGELYNGSIKAWFGDLGDGVHTGEPEDPRMALIEVKIGYVVYWVSTVDEEGFKEEVGKAAEKGEVAQNGLLRELKAEALEEARKKG